MRHSGPEGGTVAMELRLPNSFIKFDVGAYITCRCVSSILGKLEYLAADEAGTVHGTSRKGFYGLLSLNGGRETLFSKIEPAS